VRAGTFPVLNRRFLLRRAKKTADDTNSCTILKADCASLYAGQRLCGKMDLYFVLGMLDEQLRVNHIVAGTLLAAMAVPITSVAVPAANPQPEPNMNAAADEPKPVEPPKEANAPKVAVEKSSEAPGPSFRAAVRAMVSPHDHVP